MSLIKAYKKVDPGEYEATIVDLKDIDGGRGKILNIEFELEGGSFVTGEFPIEATETNQTGKLIESALGKYMSVESNDLIGRTVKVFVEPGLLGGRLQVTNIIQ